MSDSLSTFLTLNRSKYLEDLRENRGNSWTVVIGNEAGDLDSSASSIAYSYLASTFYNRPTVALLQTPRPDLQLRPENLYAYDIARLLPTHNDLLCIDDIPAELLPCVCTSTFALVDHNRLTSRFSSPPFPSSPTVVAVIDHHNDEGAHESADPRIVTVPVGSCSSLVTQYFAPQWGVAEHPPPRELATLLLAAIFIDTNGLKPGGKAVSIDRDAVSFLIPKSTFISSSLSAFNSESYRDIKEITLVMETLDERKHFVSHLSFRDLLRRDYKEYSYTSSPRVTNVGLATVPQNPKIWFKEAVSVKPWVAIDAWMNERGLDVLGVLYTYSRKGKHERQGLWVVKKGNDDIRKKLWDGLEASEELQLERRHIETGSREASVVEKEGLNEDFITPAGGMARLWLQKNHKATRKAVAPKIKELLENL